MAGNKRWSQNDIDMLKAEYGIVDVAILAKKLNRTVDAVIATKKIRQLLDCLF